MVIRVLSGITLLLAVMAATAICLLEPDKLSALGSILGGCGSLLAVLWFSAGLRYQAQQLEEQRQQFVAQFEYLKESSRRDAISLVQGILDAPKQKRWPPLKAPF